MMSQAIQRHRICFAELIAVFIFIFSTALCAQAQTAVEQQAATSLLQWLNQERFSRGLEPLNNNPELARAARQHALRMATANKVSYRLADEPALLSRISQQRLAAINVAENVAEEPSATRIHQEWMNSPARLANILNASWSGVGFGVVKRNGELFVVEDFAKTVEVLQRSLQEQLVSELVSAQNVSVEPDSTVARTYCGKTPLRVEPSPKRVMDYVTTNLHHLPPQAIDHMASTHAHLAAVGACGEVDSGGYTGYRIIVLLY